MSTDIRGHEALHYHLVVFFVVVVVVVFWGGCCCVGVFVGVGGGGAVGLVVRLVSRGTLARFRFGCPFSSERLWFVDTVLWLCPSQLGLMKH